MITEDEAAVLQGRIKDLEAALMIGSKAIGATFLLPPRLADILGILITQPVVTTDVMQTRLSLASEPKVAMHRLRKHMAKYGIKINSRNRVGYWIDDESKQQLRAMIEAKTAPREPAAPEA